MSTLAIESARCLRWLSQEALPLWTNKGYDAELGLFHERLDFSGSPRRDLPRRLMVQCRQLYVLCHLSLRGLCDERALVEQTWMQVLRRYYRPQLEHRWAFSIGPEGEAANDRCDAYTLAFVLYALAWLYRLAPRPHTLDLADELLGFIDYKLAVPQGGVIDGLPRPDELMRQNPNMHLLEAYLALHQATGRADYLDRASTLRHTFTNAMLSHEQSALPEWHGQGWRHDRQAANWYEPGHHFEWVWLLRQFGALSAGDVDEDVALLLSRALAEGVDREGLAVERVDLHSSNAQRSRRLWGTCEYLKACAAQAANAPARAAEWQERASHALAGLRQRFLASVRPGLWCDRVDAQGRALSQDVPASSLYHVVLALMESERAFGRIGPAIVPTDPSPALFLDRDGVINVDTGYPFEPQQISFMPGVARAIRLAKTRGLRVVVISNQSGVARGYGSEDDVMRLHDWMAQQLAGQGAEVDAWYHCPFHETARESAYRWPDHFDRKPNAGMLARASLDLCIDLPRSLLVGDQPRDIMAAQRAGVGGHLFEGGDLGVFVERVLDSEFN